MLELSTDELLSQATCAIVINDQIKGTGWLFSNEGHILTAGHILGKENPQDFVEVKFTDEKPHKAFRLQRGYDPGMGIDFAILQLEKPSNKRMALPVALPLEVQGGFKLRGYGKTLVDQSGGSGTFLPSFYPQDSLDNCLFALDSSQVGEGGYSGGAVFSTELGAVVALQIEATSTEVGAGRDTILVMPLYRIALLWSPFVEFARLSPNSATVVYPRFKRTATLFIDPPIIGDNLPVSLTPFVGRDQELLEIAQNLQQPNCRLLTLLGIGGIGKTILAIEVASQMRGSFPDGTYFIPLISISSPSFIIATIVEKMRLSVPDNIKYINKYLIKFLKNKKILFILDNFEHVLPDGVNPIIELLNNARDVKFLVTSQKSLNIPGEILSEIMGLTVPPEGMELSTQELLKDYSAIKLFVQNAKRAVRNFELDEENKKWVVRICQIVEGMPLAIELASSRALIKIYSCEQIAQMLTDDLDTLSKIPRLNELSRLQNLKTEFNYIWKLLSPKEKDVLKKASLFRGGFTKEAAEKIANASFPLLAQLVAEYSVIRRNVRGRFYIPETLRQYAEKKLNASTKNRMNAKKQFCDYFTEFLHRKEKLLLTDQKREIIDEIGDDLENVRLAWDLAVEEQWQEQLERSATSLFLFYDYRNYFQEGLKTFENATKSLEEHSPTVPRFLLGKLTRYQARCAYNLSLNETAIELFKKCLRLLPVSEHKERAFTRRGLASCLYKESKFSEAQQYFRRSLKMFELLGDREETATPLMRLGDIAGILGDFPEALRLRQQCLIVFTEFGDRMGMMEALVHIGDLNSKLGYYDEATKNLQAALTISTDLENFLWMAISHINLGKVNCLQKQFEEAESSLQKAEPICRARNYSWGLSVIQTYRAKILLMKGEYEAAKQILQENLSTLEAGSNRVNALLVLGRVHIELHEYDDAKRIFCEAIKLGREIKELPLVIEGVVGTASVLDGRGEIKAAMEWLEIADNQPSCLYETKERIMSLMSGLAQKLPLQEPPTNSETSKKQNLDEILEQLSLDCL